MHIHQSIVDLKTRKNVFSNATAHLHSCFSRHIAGPAKVSARPMALLCRCNSYRRLTPYCRPRSMFTGAIENPHPPVCGVPMSNAEARRVENRVSGADANPYIESRTSLACGYLGMV